MAKKRKGFRWKCSDQQMVSVPGGAIYYVIFLVFILSTVSMMFIVHRYLRMKSVRAELEYFRKMDDLSSALSLYLSDPETYQEPQEADMILFEDTSSMVHISVSPLGLFDILTATTWYRGKQLRKSVIAGKDPFNGDSIALYVPDHGQTLYVSGDSRIRGNVSIPAKGLQRASIEGKPLRIAEPVKGRILKSQPTIPALSPRITDKIKSVQKSVSIMQTGRHISFLTAASLSNSFNNDIEWYWSEEDFQISDISALGAVGFHCPGTILIRNDSRLDGTIISASSVLIEDGFGGAIQVFAKDSLVVGDGCTLTYPSVLCLYNGNINPVYVSIGKGSSVDGIVIVSQVQLSTKKPVLKVHSKGLIRGQVYHDGIIQLLGTVHGSLYCEGFCLETSRAYYENHLLDNRIDFLLLPRYFVTIDLLHGNNDQVIDIINEDI